MSLEEIGLSEGNVQESQTSVSEEELGRVREDMKKAAQARGQIMQSVQHNHVHAQLLSVLLQYVTDDVLLGAIFQQLVTHEIEPTAIFAQFIPYLKDRVDLESYHEMFASIWERAMQAGATSESLVGYLLLLRKGSEQIRKFPVQQWKVMIVRLLVVSGYGTEEEAKELVGTLE